MIRRLTKGIIIFLEFLLVSIVILYYLFNYYDIIIGKEYIGKAISLYLLSLCVYNYVALMVKSPNNVANFDGTEIRGMCRKCNQLKCSRTYHCETCDKCFYKRDHHCPWIGKCVASNNYKEFYFLIAFMNIYLLTSVLLRNINVEMLRFVNVYLLTILFIFFLWINFLLLIDKTSIEYYRSKKVYAFAKVESFWSKMREKSLLGRIYVTLLDSDLNNIKLLFLPFLRRKAVVLNE